VTVTRCAPDALLRLELWGAAADPRLPGVCRAQDLAEGRLLWIEPGAYMLRGPLGELNSASAMLTAIAGDDGAVIDITGGLARFRLGGPAWRELLTVGAVFDVENPTFGPSCVAATILHHAAIWIDVIDAGTADVYALPSYAQELAEGWARAIERLGA